MKKLFVAIGLLLSMTAMADEGMWLPYLLGQQKYAEMKAKGLKLTPEQLYSINKSSLKDAIIIFGGGCTGEIVSAEGLIFTNHHCGYGAIASASSMQNNYLRDGFYAKTKADEIPSAGLSVQFLVRIDDVTKQVLDSMKGLSWKDWEAKKAGVFDAIAKAATAGTHYEARVYGMFKDNQFIMYTYERFKDVRLVGTPPESVGKFGGDTDNWEWPRHTGDFSIFRVYAGKDGKPADFSTENVPLKPKHFLPISLKGVKEGDFSMIFGYPGSTNRFETSYGIKLATDVKNPAFVYMRDIRLKAMFEEMKKDAAVKLQLASNFASLANYWKFYDGETKQLLKYDVYATKKKQEDALQAWISKNNKAEYAGIFSNYEKAYAAWLPYAKQKEYYEQGITGPSVIKFANRLEAVERFLTKGGGDAKKALADLTAARTALLKDLNKPSEQQMLWQLVKAFNKDIVPDQQPVMFYNLMKQGFGSLNDDNTYKMWAAAAFANSLILDDQKWTTFVGNPDAGSLQNDPLYYTAKSFRENWNKYKPQLDAFNNANAELGHLYLKAYREANATKVMYPDANFSMRTSFGNVKSYKPRDGVKYDFVTTSSGLLEKYKPGDYEFDLPAKQIELLKKKDFGPYADPVRKDLVIGFITTDDITGGNSGSPVINGNGELIGLAFDGNYEALSHKINFDKDLCRTICVDIRYVLWCVDKLGGASNIIKELKLVK
ncbi:S46 family peptidase [Phnomibacter ginsenosidimutans]|uniref:Dipeptidyl-peptidase n=1 Tax=Phnomibacter ginsenosidimutans TaxID=2676868 RepID=A0A6I6GXT4_9BACT|nr:S46 family peptidase [Phnomibacter ginsenosidimutans]QGW29889.1 serine protease [Phnomibacter ginsenosidimutans]